MGEKPKKSDTHEEFRRKVEAKQKRKLRARRQGDRGVWFSFGMFGLVGWSVAVPALIFIALGIWIDATFQSRYSWTLMLLVIGIALGCLNAWFWVSRERQVIEEDLQKYAEDENENRQEKGKTHES